MKEPDRPAVLYQDDVMICAQWHSLHMGIFYQALRLSHVAVLETTLSGILARYPDGAQSLSVVLPQPPSIDIAVLRECRGLMVRMRPKVQPFALVFEEGGTWSQLITATLRSLSVMSRSAGAFLVPDGLREACAHLAPLMRASAGVTLTADELRAGIQRLKTSRDRASTAGIAIPG